MSKLKLVKGDKVVMQNCAEAERYPRKIWTCSSDPWKLGCGEEVIKLEGKSGGFSTSNLKLAEFECDRCNVKFDYRFLYREVEEDQEETGEVVNFPVQICGNCDVSAVAHINPTERHTIKLDDLPF